MLEHVRRVGEHRPPVTGCPRRRSWLLDWIAVRTEQQLVHPSNDLRVLVRASNLSQSRHARSVGKVVGDSYEDLRVEPPGRGFAGAALGALRARSRAPATSALIDRIASSSRCSCSSLIKRKPCPNVSSNSVSSLRHRERSSAASASRWDSVLAKAAVASSILAASLADSADWSLFNLSRASSTFAPRLWTRASSRASRASA